MEKVSWEETIWENWQDFKNDLNNNYVDFVNRPKSSVCSGNCFEEDSNGNIIKRCALCIKRPWGLCCELDNM